MAAIAEVYVRAGHIVVPQVVFREVGRQLSPVDGIEWECRVGLIVNVIDVKEQDYLIVVVDEMESPVQLLTVFEIQVKVSMERKDDVGCWLSEESNTINLPWVRCSGDCLEH